MCKSAFCRSGVGCENVCLFGLFLCMFGNIFMQDTMSYLSVCHTKKKT